MYLLPERQCVEATEILETLNKSIPEDAIRRPKLFVQMNVYQGS